MKFEVPEQKIERVLGLVKDVLKFDLNSAREIAKIAGHIVSMSIAVGPLSYLFTKQMYKFIESRYSWNSPRVIPSSVTKELEFWENNLRKVKSFRIKSKPEITKIF